MEGKPGSKRRDVGFFIDIIQAIIAIIAAVALSLDSTGLLDVPWIQSKLAELTFIAICTLIVTSVLERRFTLQSFNKDIDRGFEKINKQLHLLQDSLSGHVSADLLLKDRADFTRPLEIRLQNVKEVCISGKSLVGFITFHKSLVRKHAMSDCIFKILVHDPATHEKDRREVEQTLAHITEIQQDNLPAGQIEVRLTSATLSCSILMIDAKSNSGDIQVEYYAFHTSASDRPHINLSPMRDPKWYEFYCLQFENLWSNARPYQTSTQDGQQKVTTV